MVSNSMTWDCLRQLNVLLTLFSSPFTHACFRMISSSCFVRFLSSLPFPSEVITGDFNGNSIYDCLFLVSGAAFPATCAFFLVLLVCAYVLRRGSEIMRDASTVVGVEIRLDGTGKVTVDTKATEEVEGPGDETRGYEPSLGTAIQSTMSHLT